MHRYLIPALAFAGTPAFAASGPFFSLSNTDFVVLLAFILFIAILVYFKVPGILMGLLDKRAASIQSDLDQARALREEAQALLADYKRKQNDVQTQAARIVETAKKEAQGAAQKAKADMEASIARRVAAAEDQIKSAEAGAVREIRDRAIEVATAVAGEVIARQIGPEQNAALFDKALHDVQTKLH